MNMENHMDKNMEHEMDSYMILRFSSRFPPRNKGCIGVYRVLEQKVGTTILNRAWVNG